LAIVEASGVRLPIALMMVMMVMMVMVVMMMMTVAHEPRDDCAPTPVVMVVVMMMMVRDELHSRFPTHSPSVVLLECRQGIGDGV